MSKTMKSQRLTYKRREAVGSRITKDKVQRAGLYISTIQYITSYSPSNQSSIIRDSPKNTIDSFRSF